jgi:hypothetical protein
MHLRIISFAALTFCFVLAAPAIAQPQIDTKNFILDCRRLVGNTETGIKPSRYQTSGFTSILSDAAHRYYNARGRSGVHYFLVRGDVQQAKAPKKAIASFKSKQQMVQLYGVLHPFNVYTLFVTHTDERGGVTAARTVIKAVRCLPYTEPGVIPNELKHDRPKHIARQRDADARRPRRT